MHDVTSSGGRPLDTDTRADMETRLGHDFGTFRVHDDSRAYDSAVGVNANAYTVGSNIVFQRDRYDPLGRRQVDARDELTHVVQQRTVLSTAPSPVARKVSDPGDRYERERLRERRPRDVWARPDRRTVPVRPRGYNAAAPTASTTSSAPSIPRRPWPSARARRKRRPARAASPTPVQREGEEEEDDRRLDSAVGVRRCPRHDEISGAVTSKATVAGRHRPATRIVHSESGLAARLVRNPGQGPTPHGHRAGPSPARRGRRALAVRADHTRPHPRRGHGLPEPSGASSRTAPARGRAPPAPGRSSRCQAEHRRQAARGVP